jgi:hypothetical protein
MAENGAGEGGLFSAPHPGPLTELSRSAEKRLRGEREETLFDAVAEFLEGRSHAFDLPALDLDHTVVD